MERNRWVRVKDMTGWRVDRPVGEEQMGRSEG